MRKCFAGLGLLLTTIAPPAMAKDNSWYIETDAGVVIPREQTVSVLSTGAVPGNLDSKMGYDFGAIFGYNYSSFSFESEISYRRASSRQFVTPTGTTYSASNPAQLSGHSDALSVMANLLGNIGDDKGVQGYIGGGLGLARVGQSFTVNNGTLAFADQHAGFAWQAIAGLRVPLSEHWDVGVKYRYFSAPGANHFYEASSGQWMRMRYQSHSAMGTLTYYFGGPTKAEPEPAPAPQPAAPVVLAPPPPPAPPVAPVCEKGPYIVFFDWDRSEITPAAAAVLEGAVHAYQYCGPVPVMLAGYTDLSGTQRYNLALSERRNAAVRAFLISRGVPDGAISSQAYGKNNPRVKTRDGVRELQNRRVEITYGPGSGR